MTESEGKLRRGPAIRGIVRWVTGLCIGGTLLLGIAASVTRKTREFHVVVEATLPEGSFVEFSAHPSPKSVFSSGPATAERQRFEFTVSSAIRALRIDPGTLPGISRVHSVEITQRGTVLRTFSGRELAKWWRIGIDSSRVLEDGSLEITNRDNDPQLIAPPLNIEGRRGSRLGEWLAALESSGPAAFLVLSALVFLLSAAVPPSLPAVHGLREALRKYDLLLPLLIFTALFAIHARFVPIWDAQWYAGCLDVRGHVFDLARLNCLDHDPYPYMALLTLPLATLGKWYGWIHLINWACGVGAIVLFRRLFKAARPAAEPADALLAAGLFAVNPLFIISGLNLNLDWPLLIAALGFIVFWIERRPRGAAVFGLLLCFTKITGAATYFGLLFIFAALTPFFPIAATRRERTLLLAPGGIFVAVQLMHRFMEGRAALPEDVPTASLPSLLFSIDLASQRFRLVMEGISLLNFSWGLLPFIAGALAFLLAGIYFAPSLRNRPWSVDRPFLLVCAAFLASIYVASRVFLYFNPRYLLLAHVLYLLIGATCLTALLPRAVRFAAGSVLIALALFSNFATFDPVAKAALGTFKWGEHELLALGRMDGLNPGRDQLVYSPEITVVHDLLQDLYRKVRPDAQTLFVGSQYDNPNHFAYVDPRDFSRVAFATKGFPVLRASLEAALAKQAEEFVVLEEPYFGTERLADRVPGSYQIAERIPVTRRGYVIEAVRFRRTAEVPQSSR